MESTGPVEDHWSALADQAIKLPERRRVRWWNGSGLSERAEHVVDAVAGFVVLAFATGWLWTFNNSLSTTGAGTLASVDAPSPVTTIARALTKSRAPTTAYLTNAALDALTARMLSSSRGVSGKLRASFQTQPGPIKADTLPPGGSLSYARGSEVASEPKGVGIWRVLLTIGNAVRPAGDFNVITELPFSAKKNGRVGLYYIGNWPSENRSVGPSKAPAGAYGNPAGFIEVTPENADTPVSEHFKLRDFLTHDQPNVWPKYLVLRPQLVDKLELVLSDLQAHGHDVRGVKVMSGFRTPQYNYTGGNTGGRANLSRHMYGDASDIYIDNDGDGQMDDLNHDGRISIDDSRVIAESVDRVEAAHPEMVGGAGVYTAAPGHGPFIHIDARGYRARWSGTSGG
ncbi:MAG TPA: hypothetical protein VGP95_12160 [Gemmatimonadaceae bacterium]|nr:hypothetical protein [Gemmatimonadaceae bacterium]